MKSNFGPGVHIRGEAVPLPDGKWAAKGYLHEAIGLTSRLREFQVPGPFDQDVDAITAGIHAAREAYEREHL